MPCFFAAAMILLPLIAIRGVWRQLPSKANALVYFSALGIGFIAVAPSDIDEEGIVPRCNPSTGEEPYNCRRY